jgi:hypothetical protein
MAVARQQGGRASVLAMAGGRVVELCGHMPARPVIGLSRASAVAAAPAVD